MPISWRLSTSRACLGTMPIVSCVSSPAGDDLTKTPMLPSRDPTSRSRHLDDTKYGKRGHSHDARERHLHAIEGRHTAGRTRKGDTTMFTRLTTVIAATLIAATLATSAQAALGDNGVNVNGLADNALSDNALSDNG